ncbi:MAG TPA: hypothetical protein VNN79_06865, partial [Actinomycetota bacterium]|nr:hypothetical protein [Actinomycetota bacterium]
TGDALRRAVDRLGGTFESCAPGEPDEWLTGTIDPGRGASFPARCSATVDSEDGFAVVRLRFVTPPDAPPVTFGRYFADTVEQRPNGLHEDRTVAEWRLVVDPTGATIVEGPDCMATDRRGGGELRYFGLGGPVPVPGSCGGD